MIPWHRDQHIEPGILCQLLFHPHKCLNRCKWKNVDMNDHKHAHKLNKEWWTHTQLHIQDTKDRMSLLSDKCSEFQSIIENTEHVLAVNYRSAAQHSKCNIDRFKSEPHCFLEPWKWLTPGSKHSSTIHLHCSKRVLEHTCGSNTHNYHANLRTSQTTNAIFSWSKKMKWLHDQHIVCLLSPPSL